MRILHTSDWHLGITLHEVDRQAEHRLFLEWLLGVVEEKAIDAIVIAGDVFDTINPSAEATRQLYGFLARLQETAPGVQVVLVGGNHDSAGRLEAPRELFGLVNTRVLGCWPWEADGKWITEQVCLSLSTRDGKQQAWLGTVPYLRPGDLARWLEEDMPEEEVQASAAAAMRRCYAATVAELHARRQPEEPLLLTGHLYAMGARIREGGSERMIQKGNIESIPLDVFPAEVAYVALGHLHQAQIVGGSQHIRYSGSPFPLSFVEADTPHLVLVAEFTGSILAKVEEIEVPKTRELLRAHGSREEVLEKLTGLPISTAPAGLEPLLDVRVTLNVPEPGLRTEVEKAIEGKGIRLTTVHAVFAEFVAADADLLNAAGDLEPLAVFRGIWRKECAGAEPLPDVEDAFRQILEAVENPVE